MAQANIAELTCDRLARIDGGQLEVLPSVAGFSLVRQSIR